MNDYLQCVIVHLISQQKGSKDEELKRERLVAYF